MAFECKRIGAVSLLTVVSVCILCVGLTEGQCVDALCPCVPPEREVTDIENRCCIYISENLPPGSLIGNANDLEVVSVADPGPDTFQLDSLLDLPLVLFRVNESTGAITTAAEIDREIITSNPDAMEDCIRFRIDATEAGRSPLRATALFGVVIIDANDNRPQFNQNITVLHITVPENEVPYSLNCHAIPQLDLLEARDIDNGVNGSVTYEVAQGYGDDLFSVITPRHPCVDNIVPMDRENPDNITYSFVLLAKDGGSPPLTSNITVVFTLLDINDNPPVFLNDTMTISVRENTTVGEVIARFQATDKDEEKEPLRYGLKTTSLPFRINHTTGEVSLTALLDAETTFGSLNIVVVANDSNSTHSSDLSVSIMVTDVNEPITIPADQSIPSEILEGELINFQLRIEDADKDPDNMINEFQLVSGEEYFRVAGSFTVGNNIIHVIQIDQHSPIDRENVTNSNFELELLIEQFSDPVIETLYVHNFTVLDINDNEPYLTQRTFNETEVDRDSATTAPSIPLKDFVKDDDAGENGTVVSFVLLEARDDNNRNIIPDFETSNAITDDPVIHNGNLHLPLPLDREKYGEVMTVTMNFTDGGSPPMSRIDSFKIRIIDINDNSPIFVEKAYTFSMTENRSPNTLIGSVMASDLDDASVGNGMVEYYLDDTQGDYVNFTVDPIEGIIRNKVSFDREEKASYTVYVYARDKGNPPRTASNPVMVTITIQDLNDEPPQFTMKSYNFQVNSEANVGDFVQNVEAVDPDLDPMANQIVYNFVNPTLNFLIENNTGRITLARVLSIQESPYNLTVVAYNPGSEQLNSTASVTVRVSAADQLTAIVAATSSVVGVFLILIVIVCCCICCLSHRSRTTGKHEVNGNGSHLNNQKPILKTFTATNGQQSLRSVKFSQTVEETHYDPSGMEHQVIRKESNLGSSGDESPQTSLRNALSNGPMNIDSREQEEIIDYETSPSIVFNGDVPHRSQYGRHRRMDSPIMLREELNTSEYSQSTSSVMDDRNTYNSEGEEAESTFSDAPSNFNISIPRFGRQGIQVEDHRHPSNLAHFVAPTSSHTPLDMHLPPVHHMHPQHSSPNQLAELRAHNLAAYDAQLASAAHPVGVPPGEDIRDLSLSSLPRNITHHHRHGSMTSSHTTTPPTRHITRELPPPGMHQQHSMVSPPSNGHTNTRNYPHPLVMPDAFPARGISTDVHRFDSFIPSFGDYEASTYASTELNEALEFKYEAEPDFCSLTATDYGENDTEL